MASTPHRVMHPLINLCAQNPEWGVRDLEEVAEVANKEGLKLLEVIEMPANNLSVVFQRKL